MKKLSFILIILATSCMNVTVVSSDVANKITRLNREIPQVKADLALKKKINNDINKNKKNFLEDNNFKNFGYYDIDIIEGRVLLTGIVYNDNVKQYIVEKITANIKVRELLDELIVSSNEISKFNDYLIKKTIKTKIFFRTKIKSLNYEMSVINGTVYIMGIAENNEELKLLTKLISTVKGVKKVVSYIITVDNDKKIKFEFL